MKVNDAATPSDGPLGSDDIERDRRRLIGPLVTCVAFTDWTRAVLKGKEVAALVHYRRSGGC